MAKNSRIRAFAPGIVRFNAEGVKDAINECLSVHVSSFPCFSGFGSWINGDNPHKAERAEFIVMDRIIGSQTTLCVLFCTMNRNRVRISCMLISEAVASVFHHTITVGVIGGMPLIATDIVDAAGQFKSGVSIVNSITGGFGSTLGSIGIIIGFGVMMGQIFEVSGAAKRMAYTFLKLFGKGKEEMALRLWRR